MESRAALIHTAEMTAAGLAAARELLDIAFKEAFTDQDWEHALGGRHALAWDGPRLVGHASLVQLDSDGELMCDWRDGEKWCAGNAHDIPLIRIRSRR